MAMQAPCVLSATVHCSVWDLDAHWRRAQHAESSCDKQSTDVPSEEQMTILQDVRPPKQRACSAALAPCFWRIAAVMSTSSSRSAASSSSNRAPAARFSVNSARDRSTAA